jgi:glycosyltransferase involved in cell wall biosynthesis
VKLNNITTANTEFVLISFEGPDCYSNAGGLGVRMQNLSRTLAKIGFVTHLFYIGDPKLPGEEISDDGRLILHRWCQWISEYYPSGVYDGEEGKLRDFNDSIPPFVLDNVIKPAIAKDKLVVILGEEWQTAEVMCRLSDVLYNEKLRGQVIMFWNANNTFSFHRINWSRLNFATTITTISRYMKYLMERMGLNPLVIPNGIPKSSFHNIDSKVVKKLRTSMGAEIILCKVARWDPDKRWIEAVDAVANMKRLGLKTTLLARGGREPYGQEVLSRARASGLTISEANNGTNNRDGYMEALTAAAPADIIDIRFQLPLDFLSIMYRTSDAVLANSAHEPFGIVGLEAMAAGGVVFTGSTGEDYAIPFVNSFMIETSDPMEIVSYVKYLKNYPLQMERMRRVAKSTARYYTWESAIQNLIGKLENQGRIQGTLSNNFETQVSITTPAEIIIEEIARKLPNEQESLQELRRNRCIPSKDSG